MWPWTAINGSKSHSDSQPSSATSKEGFIITMHSAKHPNRDQGIQNSHNPPVHGPERPQSISGAGDVGLLVHSLYVGSRDGKAFPDADRRAVIDAVSAEFDCFTVVDADGYFKGRSVATLVIKIATNDTASVETLGRDLGRLLDQQAVGLETAGYYKSISMA
jgi:hypothetical protein